MLDMKYLWELREKLNPNEGLPFELFEWISTLVPIANVDLLILNEKGEILLSWRDDEYYGKGWHLPGGCIRFKETSEDRIQKTALNEIGTEVIFKREPIATRDMIMGNPNEKPIKRAHHLTTLYECKLPDGFEIDNGNRTEDEVGFLKWFDMIPKDILNVHSIYNDVFMSLNIM